MQMPFASLQALFDPLLPKGLQWCWKGDYVDELSDAAIALHIEHGRQDTERALADAPLPHRRRGSGRGSQGGHRLGRARARWSMVIAGIDPDPAKAPDA